MTDEKRIQLLEYCVKDLQKYIKVIKGEEQDLTGLGLWRLFCNSLERAMECKVITLDQWEAFTSEH